MIPGDPVGLEVAADDYDRAGDEFARLRDEIVTNARRTCAEWLGVAGELAWARLVRLGTGCSIAAEVCHGSARALREYAAQLRIAQREYAAAAEREQAALAELNALLEGSAPTAVIAPVSEKAAAASAVMAAARARARSTNQAAAVQIGRLSSQLPEMLPPGSGSSEGPSYDVNEGARSKDGLDERKRSQQDARQVVAVS